MMAASMLAADNGNAAERRVLVEQVTATWCGPCQSVGRATIDLLSDYPDSITGFQIHGSDSYTIAWGNTRMSFYGVTGFPTVWMDGTQQQYGSYGSDSGNYANLQSMMNTCLSVPTDVTISSSGQEIANDQYQLTYQIGVEAGGSPRTMKFHCVQNLNYYPAGTHYYNCLIQANSAPTITVQPGETYELTHTFTLSGASLSDKDNVNYIAWCQTTASSSPAQVYNSDFHEHGQLPPSTVNVPGDYPSIMAAIEDVGQYSTINIAPGTYYELIDPMGKNVSLVGTGGAEATIIDGGNAGTVVTLLSGENSNMVLDGLTIQNGSNSISGGMKCNANPVIRNCIIRDNSADVLVGGLSSASSPGPSISDTHFCNNAHADIYGDYVDGGGNTFADSCDDGPVCPGDFDGSTSVDVNDLLTVIQQWSDPYTVDDLLTVIANWGSTCP